MSRGGTIYNLIKVQMTIRTDKAGYNLFIKDKDLIIGPMHNEHDAFHRLRVSEPVVLFEDKHNYAKNDGTNGMQNWFYEVAASGAATYNTNESTVDLNVTTGSTDRSTKRTVRYFPYTPGMSQTVVLTAVLGAGETGCEKRIGLFDDDNGVYYSEIDGVYGVGYRSKVTGSAVDTVVTQANWNVDCMDGTGPSKITVDFTKTQIFQISLQWLGAGTTTYSLDIEGELYPVHVTIHSNNVTTTFMTTATLPITYDIRNTGTLSGAQELKTICCAVLTEGPSVPVGLTHTESNGITTAAVTTRRPLLAIRLLDAYEGKANRTMCKALGFSGFAQTNAGFFELVHVTGYTSITGDWVAVDSGVSSLQKSVNISAVSGGTEHVIDSFTAPASNSGKRATHTESSLSDVIDI